MTFLLCYKDSQVTHCLHLRRDSVFTFLNSVGTVGDYGSLHSLDECISHSEIANEPMKTETVVT